MSLEQKRNALIKKRERFESAMLIGFVFALVTFGSIGPLVDVEIPVIIGLFAVITSFGAGYLAGHYLPIRKWFN